MKRVVECVPNFSEGRDRETIAAITAAMERAGAKVLDVDMGAATNRTVVTMAGSPEAVEEAAFQAIKVATERIDMRLHRGEHPRIGATDVCPFVPIRGVTMAECVEIARRVGARVGRQIGIPVYLYGEAASTPARRNLPDIRQGEYEGLAERLRDPAWKPDFGPAEFVPRSGATVIGAREFLIAYNVNLNTRDRTAASRIAVRLREAGGIARGPDGEPLVDPTGRNVHLPGLLRDVRAVGWVIEEYGIAQVSVNVLNFRRTPLHVIYEEARRLASAIGVSVTGSEIVGMIPLDALLMSGRYYLERQGLSPAAPEREVVHIAVRSLGLSDVKQFVPDEKVIEYRLAHGQRCLTNRTLREFTDDVSLDTPIPGGGSVAALAGALAGALTAMVANLTIRRPGIPVEARGGDIEGLKALAIEAQSLKEQLLALVSEDSEAFNAVMASRRLPAGSPERDRAIREATLKAAEVPAEVVRLCARAAEVASVVAKLGNPNCLSDVGVGAAMALAGAEGAALNVFINLAEIQGSDETLAADLRSKTLANLDLARGAARATLEGVSARLVKPTGEN